MNPDTGMYESAYERGYSCALNGNLTAKRFYDPAGTIKNRFIG